MPELPEVHTITSDLSKIIKNGIISRILVAENYKLLPDNITMVNTVTGKKVLSVSRIAKNIVWELEDETYIRFHLAMTGRILVRTPKDSPKWTKVAFRIKTEKGDHIDLAFTDIRMFGKVELLNNNEFIKLKQKYGPEPIDNGLTPEKFLECIRGKRSTIKNCLLDQEIISGLGNIYATDALFLARIHPETNSRNITLEMAHRLLQAARQVLEEGIKNRGSTLPDKMYVDIYGKAGSQQDHFKIYLKEKCDDCGGTVAFKKINGRGTYFCPNYQKFPYENKHS